jgi:hypothetical protein
MVQGRKAVLAAMLLTAGVLSAQDIHSASSGSIQSVRAGVSQNVRAGAIARGPGGEKSGTGGFGTSETKGRFGSGKVAGYGIQAVGSQGEYASRSFASYGDNRDFPTTDFVGTLPKPALGAGPAMAAGFSHPSASFASPAPHHSGGGSHASHHAGIKDPSAILNPFTHQIGPSINMPGVGSLAGSGLGSGH